MKQEAPVRTPPNVDLSAAHYPPGPDDPVRQIVEWIDSEIAARGAPLSDADKKLLSEPIITHLK